MISVIFLIIISSFSSTNQQDQSKQEYIDIRVGGNSITVDSKRMSLSGAISYLSSTVTDEQTKVRLIISEIAPTGHVNKISRILSEKGITSIYSIMLRESSFQEYYQVNLHLDILENGRVGFRGEIIYVDDFLLAFKNVSPEITIIISVGDNVNYGNVLDVQKKLSVLGFRKQDSISKYEYSI